LRPRGATADFVEALSEANVGSGSWSAGWTVTRDLGDTVAARRAGLELLVPRERCEIVDGGGARSELEARVLLPKELLTFSPGHYVALGDRELDERPPHAGVRVYFNVSAEGATAVVGSVTAELNARRVPFRLKVLDDPLVYFRCDTGVLFMDEGDFAAARPSLRNIVRRIRPWLEDDVPALTKRLTAGVGAGASPGTSFGSSRCRLLASAALHAFESGTRELADRVAAVERAYTAAGLSLDAPYLEPGRRADYAL
jgi:hypothetical protein